MLLKILLNKREEGLNTTTAKDLNSWLIHYESVLTWLCIFVVSSRFMEPVVITLLGGVLPFGSIFIEMYFIFTSFWAYKIYYVYGFMLLVFIILAIVTVCVTIVCTYFLLNAEDYRWYVQWLFKKGDILMCFLRIISSSLSIWLIGFLLFSLIEMWMYFLRALLLKQKSS